MWLLFLGAKLPNFNPIFSCPIVHFFLMEGLNSMVSVITGFFFLLGRKGVGREMVDCI